MVMLKNPNEPATSKQLWLLHILTKQDTRNWKLTMLEASQKIESLKSGKSNNQSSDKKPIEPKPINEISVIQGAKPNNKIDLTKIKADFMLNAYPLAVEKLKRSGQTADNVDIGFYEFNCEDCLFGQTGICEPKWDESSYSTCENKVESVSFRCNHFEPTYYKPNCYCKRPKGKQCHRKKIDNKCLECSYRSRDIRFSPSLNRSEWYSYIPTLNERISQYNKDLETRLNPGDNFKDIDFTESVNNYKDILRLLNKLNV